MTTHRSRRAPTAKQRPMQAALAKHLEAEGHIAPGKISKRPQKRYCRKCGAQVITAITDLSGVFDIDPVRLNDTGEFIANLAGTMTWEITHREITHRYELRRHHAADTNVHPTHVCGLRVPPEWTLPPQPPPGGSRVDPNITPPPY